MALPAAHKHKHKHMDLSLEAPLAVIVEGHALMLREMLMAGGSRCGSCGTVCLCWSKSSIAGPAWC